MTEHPAVTRDALVEADYAAGEPELGRLAVRAFLKHMRDMYVGDMDTERALGHLVTMVEEETAYLSA